MMAGWPAYFAHAFGNDFSLPLPLWLFMYAGAAAVLLSFVLTWLFSDGRPLSAKTSRGWQVPVWLRRGGQLLALGLLALAIIAGIIGTPVPEDNFNVTFSWVIVFVGLTYLTVLLGDFWSFINPFRAVAAGFIRLTGLRPVWRYPRRWGHWPALVVYVVVIALELVFNEKSTTPSTLSTLLLEYLVIGVSGSVAFGVKDWFRYADFFALYFRLVGKLAPLAYTAAGRIQWRRPLSGLLASGANGRPVWQSADSGLLLFVLFMLASTSFDGFTETSQYAALRQSAPDIIGNSPEAYGLLVMLLTLGLFAALYIGCMYLTKRLVETRLTSRQLAYAFMYSLLPIALGYNLAHYLSYLLLTGQGIIRLISDPFGWGWDLFGTADYQANTTFLSQYSTWYLQVAAIIIGHVAAVFVAHQIASRVFVAARQVTLSQLPMLALMVLYTVASLWIIAQPVYVAQAKVQAEERQERQFLEVLRMPAPPLP